MSNQIILDNVCKSFGSQKIFADCCCAVDTNTCMLLLGANGSGKSTLLGLIAGTHTTDRGHIEIPAGVRVGYLSQDLQLYRYLTVYENIELFARLANRYQQIEDELAYWQLSPYREYLINDLSRGWQQRVNLCRLFLQNANFLVLDEPSSHLDNLAVALLKKRINRAVQEQTISGLLLATHDLYNLTELASSVYILAQTGQGTLNYYPPTELNAAITNYQEINR